MVNEKVELGTFADAKKNFFRGLGQQFQKNLHYLEELASSTNTNISDWPIEAYQSAENRRTINKIFFGMQAESAPKISNEEVLAGLGSALVNLDKKVQEQVMQVAANARSNMDYAYAQAHEHMKRFNEKMREASNQRAIADKIEGNKGKCVTTEVSKILQIPFYTNHTIPDNGSWLKMETANEIILTEVNPKAGIDRRINMGKYKVMIELFSNEVRVDYHSNNLQSRGHIHPYISGSGNVCWGTASDAVHKMQKNRESAEILNLLSSLLSTYSPDSNPYQRLMDFEEPNRRRVPLQPPHPMDPQPPSDRGDICGVCDTHIDDCTCHTCSICEETMAEGDDCGCCMDCENVDGECECCEDCGEIGDDCNRCRECLRHDGEHGRSCSSRGREREETTSNEEIEF